MRGKTCETLDEYIILVKAAFKTECIDCKVETVMVVADWVSILESCIDPHLALLFKEDDTQHQLRYEAVQRSVYFPLGVKTCFKAYSSDKVIEFSKLPKEECLTDIGQHIGLEPKTTFNTWQPEPYGVNSCPTRQGVEGVHLLQCIPHREYGQVEYAEMKESVVQTLKKTLRCIRKKYNRNYKYEIRLWWENWFKIYCPPIEICPYRFIDQLRTKQAMKPIPLQNILLNQNTFVENKEWTITSSLHDKFNPEFEWPEVLQAAMNSVQTSYNRIPGEPRLQAQNDRDLILVLASMAAATEAFYTQNITVLNLRTEIRIFCVDYDGINPATSTLTKAPLVDWRRKWAKSFCVKLFRPLNLTHASLVRSTIDFPCLDDTSTQYVIASIKDTNVSRLDIKSFDSGQKLSDVCIDAIIGLFQHRDSKICEAYVEVNPDMQEEFPPTPSVFLPLTFMSKFLQDPTSVELATYFQVYQPFDKLNRIYCPRLINEERQLFGLVVLDVKLKNIYYMDPTIIDRGHPSQDVIDFLNILLPSLNQLSDVLDYNFQDWHPASLYPFQYYEPISEDRLDRMGTVIHLFTLIYFCIKNIPIYFTNDLVRDVVRFKFCYWIMSSELSA